LCGITKINLFNRKLSSHVISCRH